MRCILDDKKRQFIGRERVHFASIASIGSFQPEERYFVLLSATTVDRKD